MRKIVLRVDRKHSALQNAEIVLDQGKQQMIFILLFTVLYLFRDLGGANIPDIVFTGLCAAAFIMADMGTCLGMYIFTTTLTVPHNEIKMVYFIIIVAKMLFSGIVQLNGKMLLIILGMLFVQLIDVSIFSANKVENIIYDYATRMMTFVIPLFWFSDEYTAEDFRSALMCYVMGVVLGGTVVLILTAERISWEALLKGTRGTRLGATYHTDEGMQTTYNANQLGVMFSVTGAIIVQNIDRKQMSQFLGFLLLGYSIFLIVLTRSRTALLMLAMVVIVYCLYLVVSRKKMIGGFSLLAMVGVLGFVVIKFFPELVDAILSRFVDQEDITNGRVDIFVDYIKAWINDPWCFLFGYGVGSAVYVVNTGYSPHNILTDILISWGLAGLFLVGGCIIICWKKGVEGIDKQNRIIAPLPAMVALVASMAGQYLTTGFPHMRLCFFLLAAKAWLEEKNQMAPKEKITNG